MLTLHHAIKVSAPHSAVYNSLTDIAQTAAWHAGHRRRKGADAAPEEPYLLQLAHRDAEGQRAHRADLTV